MATKKSGSGKQAGKASAAQKKVGRVMHEFKHGELHSGSKQGPKVKNPKQAIAIGLSEARKAGAKVPPRKSAGVKGTSKRTAGKRSPSKGEAKKR